MATFAELFAGDVWKRVNVSMKRPEPETWRLGTELVGKARSKRFTWGHQKVGHLYFCDLLLGKFTKTKAFHKSHWLILNVSYLFMCFSCISFPRSSVCLHVCILFLWLHVTLSYLYLSYAVFINLVLHCVWQPFFLFFYPYFCCMSVGISLPASEEKNMSGFFFIHK